MADTTEAIRPPNTSAANFAARAGRADLIGSMARAFRIMITSELTEPWTQTMAISRTVPVPQLGGAAPSFAVWGAYGLATTRRTAKQADSPDQLTPSFFCRLDDEVVY